MVFQPRTTPSNEFEKDGARFAAGAATKLQKLFTRRAEKADTYHRIELVAHGVDPS